MRFWNERPPFPVCMAWAVAGALALVLVVLLCYGLVSLVSWLTS